MTLTINQDTLKVRRALQTYRRAYVFSLVLVFISKAAVVLFGALILLQLIFSLLPWTLLPVLWDGSIVIFGAVVLFFTFYKCVLHRLPLGNIAALVEKKAGLPHPWLSLAMELDTDAALGSRDLKNNAVRRARECLAQCPRSIHDFPSRRWTAALALFAAAWLTIFGAVEPRCAAFWKLPLSLGTKLQASIFPGTVSLPMHSSITLRCVPPAGAFPSSRISLAALNDNSEQSFLLRPDSSGGFSVRRDSLTSSFSYRFSISNTTFGPETIRVVPRARRSRRSDLSAQRPGLRRCRPGAAADGAARERQGGHQCRAGRSQCRAGRPGCRHGPAQWRALRRCRPLPLTWGHV